MTGLRPHRRPEPRLRRRLPAARGALLVYNLLHPRGFSAAVLVQNANESVAIGFVAMAQTVPVLMGGLDLSVGAVMTLTNCIASELVSGSPAQIVLGMIATLAAGTPSG